MNCIKRYCEHDVFPELNKEVIVIFIGAHKEFERKLVDEIDEFCEKYNAVVFCDQTSNFTGKYKIFSNVITQQKFAKYIVPDLIIHLGDVSSSANMTCVESWRVNIDGEIRDTFRKLTNVFSMDEFVFFNEYNKQKNDEGRNVSLYEHYRYRYKLLIDKWKEIENVVPFSNVWIASQLHDLIPHKSLLFLGILNSLRSWNYFETDDSIRGYSNTGGFGIDGGMSSMIGASMVFPNTLCYLITGDLAFFYDMNSLGIRGLGNNVRILLINNAIGEEFKHNMTVITKAGFQDEANRYMAAEGHFGNKSKVLVKHYAEDLGFIYLSASNKQDFLNNVDTFINPTILDKPILFEVFTDHGDETDAIETIQTLEKEVGSSAKAGIRKLVGEKGIDILKKVVR